MADRLLQRQKPEEKLDSYQWRQIEALVVNAQEFKKIELGNGYEIRFVPMPEQSFSVLLSRDHVDVFHFMWTEVEGLLNITHRIVNPLYRGQGIGTQVMQMICKRAEHLAEQQKIPVHLMLETSQLSVVQLGIKAGLQLTAGRDHYRALEQGDQRYRVDVNSHITDSRGNRLLFRLSQAFRPSSHTVDFYQRSFRNDIWELVAAAV